MRYVPQYILTYVIIFSYCNLVLGGFVFIQDVNSQQCLEGTSDGVYFEDCNEADSQMWTLQSTIVGTFFFINKKDGYVSPNFMGVY